MLIYSAAILALLVFFVMLACIEHWRDRRRLPADEQRGGAGLALVVFIFGVLGYWSVRADMIARSVSNKLPGTLLGLVVIATLAGWVIYCICCRAVAENSAIHGRVFLAQHAGTNRLRLVAVISLIILLAGCYSVAVLYFSGAVARLAATVTPTGWGVVAVIGAGWFEEIFFRGWVQNRLARWVGKQQPKFSAHLSVWLTAILFAGAHFQGPVKFVQIFPLGLVFGYVARRWGLAAAIFVHAATNCLHEVLIWAAVRMTIA